MSSTFFPSNAAATATNVAPRQLTKVRSVHMPKWLPEGIRTMKGPLALAFPYIAIVTWYVFNIVTLLTNKYIFQKLPFPTGLTIMHMAIGYLLSSLYVQIADSTQKDRPSQISNIKDRIILIFPVAMSFAGNLYFSNLAMRWVSVPFVQMVKSTVPGFTMILYVLFKGRKYETQCYVAMFFIVTGVMMAVVSDVTYNLIGLVSAIFGAFCTALKVILTNDVTKNLNPTVLLNYMAPFVIITLVPIFYFTEWESLRDEYWDRVFNVKTFGSLVIHGGMVFVLNFVMFFAASVNSPVIMTVAGNMKVILVCIFSVISLGTEMGMWSWVGCLVCLLGGLHFNLVQSGVDPLQIIYDLNSNFAEEQEQEEHDLKKR